MQQGLYQKLLIAFLSDQEQEAFNFHFNTIDKNTLFNNEASFLDKFRNFDEICRAFRDVDIYYYLLALAKKNIDSSVKPLNVPERDTYGRLISKLLPLIIYYFSELFGLSNVLKLIPSVKIGLKKVYLSENKEPDEILLLLKKTEEIIIEELNNQEFPYLNYITDITLSELYSLLVPNYIRPTAYFNNLLRGQRMIDKIEWKKGGPDLAFLLHFLYSKELISGSGFINKIRSQFHTKFNPDNLQRMYNNVNKNEINSGAKPKKKRTALIDILIKCDLYK